jgi:hypothetical protein
MSQEGGGELAPSTADFVSFPPAEATTTTTTMTIGAAATATSSSSRPQQQQQQQPPLPSISEARSQGSYRSVSAPPALRREFEYDDDYRAFPDADDYEKDRTCVSSAVIQLPMRSSYRFC